MFRDTTYIIIIIVVVDILCVLFSGFALTCSQKEKGEKSIIFGGIVVFLCAVSTLLGFLVNISVPKPVILPLDNEAQSYSDEVEVTLTSERGEIYYTLDGSDPMYGKRYEGTINLAETTTVSARSKSLFKWSEIEKSMYRVESKEENLSNTNAASGSKKRETYSYQQINEGILGDKITFNSIKVTDTDAAWAETKGLELPLLSNETNFVGAREDTGVNAGSGNAWEGTEIVAEDGKTYIVRLYVHNNASGGMDSVAEDTQVRFYVPYGSADQVTMNGWLTSSNAVPQQYSDTVVFNSIDGMPFHLEYVSGSALLENGGFAKGAGIQLPDSITNQGNPTNKAEDEWTLIGYNALDGRVPGCYGYINYVSIKVKVIYEV